MKKRILLLTARSDAGGGPRHVYDLVAGLAEKNQVFVAAPLEKPFGEKFQSLAKGFFEIPKRAFSISRFYSLARFCRQHEISIVHSHGRGAGIYSRLLGLLGYRVIHSFHGFHPQPSLKNRVTIWIEKVLAFCTDAFLVVSQDEKERTIAFAVAKEGKTFLVYNGIQKNPPNAISPAPRGLEKSGKYVFGSLTRFDPQKGNLILLQHLSDLPASIKGKIEVRIAGDGEERAAIQEFVVRKNLEQMVKLVGVVSDAAGFLRECNAFVSSSKGEGCSYACLEALNEGRPLLISRVVGHVELQGVHGVSFFRIGDQKEFEKEISKLLNTEDKQAIVLPQKFTVEEMVDKIDSLYENPN